MKPIMIILLWIIPFLTGCNLPQAMSTSQPEVEETAASSKIVEEPDFQPTSTATIEPIPSQTAEIQADSTSTTVPTLPTSTPPIFPAIQPLTSGELVILTKIQMVDSENGWGTGYQDNSGTHILYTEDGGRTWEDRTPPDAMADQSDEIESAWVHFLGPKKAWVIYVSQKVPSALLEKFIWRTADSGLTWDQSALLDSDGAEEVFIPRGFASFGEDHGWLLVNVGAGMSHDYSYLYQTLDGGMTWERIIDPYGSGIQSLRNTGIAFADAEYGWVSKDNLGVMPGAFFEQTSDGGRTWEDIFLPIPPELDWFNEISLCETLQPTFTADQNGMLIVRCRLPGDLEAGTDWSLTYIYRTSDRAESWQHTLLPTTVERLLFLDGKLGWTFGRDHYRTTDGGVTWQWIKTVNWDGDFSFVDPTLGWAVARNEAEIALVATEDGGATWQMIEPLIR